MNLRKLRWAIIAYALIDLYIGGNCGGFLPLQTATATAQTVALLQQGQVGVSCNAVTAATSLNPGVAGGCTSLALVTSGGALPSTYTWQVLTTGSPTGLTVTFQGSLDGVTWNQLGTTSSASTNTVASGNAYRFLGCIPSTLSGGSSPTVTCQVSVTSATGAGVASAASALTGQIPCATNGTSVALWCDPGIINTQISTTPHAPSCDTATTIGDRGKSFGYASGSSVITVPDVSTAACANAYFLLDNEDTGPKTVNRSGSNTFTVINGLGVQNTGLTTFQLFPLQHATLISLDNATIWKVLIRGNVEGSIVCTNATPCAASATTFFTTPAAGNNAYYNSEFVTCTSAVNTATVSVTVTFTDLSNTVQTQTSGVSTCTTLGASSFTRNPYSFMALPGTAVQYNVTTANAPVYTVAVKVIQQ